VCNRPIGSQVDEIVRVLVKRLAEKQHPLELRQVFRIAFTVKGKDVSGCLDIDNIRLVR